MYNMYIYIYIYIVQCNMLSIISYHTYNIISDVDRPKSSGDRTRHPHPQKSDLMNR